MKGVKIILSLLLIAGLMIALFPLGNGLVTERQVTQQAESFIAKAELLPVFTEAVQSTNADADLPYQALLDAMRDYNGQLYTSGQSALTSAAAYQEVIYDNIEYAHLLCEPGIDREQLNEIAELIVDTVCSGRKTIRVAGDDHPAEVVKSRFLKLDSSHVDFALKKDRAAEKPRYLVFFKSRDADAITAALREFTARRLHRRPSVRERLAQAKVQMAQRMEHRDLDREKVMDRSVPR